MAAIFAAMQPILIKQYIRGHNIYFALAAVIAAIILLYYYYKIFQHYDVAIGYLLIKLIAIMMVILVSIAYFNEQITPRKMIGIILGIITIFILY